MTGMRESAYARGDAPFTGDELATLAGFLDFERATLLRKCEGLTDEQLRFRLPSSPLTLAGLLKHTALDEDSWFSERFAGRPELALWAGAPFDVDPDWEFHSAAGEHGDDLRTLYLAACARSRDAVSGHSADDRSALPMRTGESFALRWVFGHMIEETARHNGHADLLREAIDGATGE